MYLFADALPEFPTPVGVVLLVAFCVIFAVTTRLNTPPFEVFIHLVIPWLVKLLLSVVYIVLPSGLIANDITELEVAV